MNPIIIYGSCYGTSKMYAEALAKQTGAPVLSFKEVKSLEEYDFIVYIGGLYAGKVLGLTPTLKRVKEGAAILLVTVGLADPKSAASMATVRKGLDKQIPKPLWGKVQHIHLRGAIDYETLTVKHSMMMSFLVNYLKKQPPEKQTPENQIIIDTYGQKVDFTDLAALESIAARFKQ